MAEIYKPESSEMAKTWNPQEVEDKLYREWEENGYFTAHREEGKKPFTIVMPPPNITGQLAHGSRAGRDAAGRAHALSCA